MGICDFFRIERMGRVFRTPASNKLQMKAKLSRIAPKLHKYTHILFLCEP
jgi:hypothetical protein